MLSVTNHQLTADLNSHCSIGSISLPPTWHVPWHDRVSLTVQHNRQKHSEMKKHTHTHTHTHTRTRTHTRLMALCPGLPGWAGTRKVKPIWILLKQATVSGSGISWAVWKSAPRTRQVTIPGKKTQVFYRPDAFLPPNQQWKKHWRQGSIKALKANREDQVIYRYNQLYRNKEKQSITRHKKANNF